MSNDPLFNPLEGNLVITHHETILSLPEFGDTKLTMQGEPDEEITSEQQQVLQWFLGDFESLKDAVLRAIFEYYQKEAPLYREAYDPDWVEIDVPHVDHYIGMAHFLSEPQIYVPLDQELTELSIVFECTWEMEHGVGVRFRDRNIDEVGGADIAF